MLWPGAGLSGSSASRLQLGGQWKFVRARSAPRLARMILSRRADNCTPIAIGQSSNTTEANLSLARARPSFCNEPALRLDTGASWKQVALEQPFLCAHSSRVSTLFSSSSSSSSDSQKARRCLVVQAPRLMSAFIGPEAVGPSGLLARWPAGRPANWLAEKNGLRATCCAARATSPIV